MCEYLPLELHRDLVRPEWIDYNGHMNVAYYVLVFDHATDALQDLLGMDSGYRERTGCSCYVLETHVTYERELKCGAPVRISTQLLDYDAKRIHFFHRMYDDDRHELAATTELITMHVETAAGKSVAMPESVIGQLGGIMSGHRLLERPEQVGRIIGIRAEKSG